MPAPYQLKIISREKIAFEGTVESVTVPAIKGSMGIWANHAPLITALDKGPLIYREPGGTDQRFQVQGGYIEIRNNLVTVLTEQFEG